MSTSEQSKPGSDGASHATILVVDDDADHRDTVAVVLEMAGHEVRVASDGAEAIALLDSGVVPDVILVDLLMPGMDGATFLEQLAQHPLPRRPQCVVLTGLVSRHLQHLLGGYPVLFKPYRAEQLLELVASVLAAR